MGSNDAFFVRREDRGALHQWDVDNHSAFCLDAPQCQGQTNLIEPCDICGHGRDKHLRDNPGCIGGGIKCFCVGFIAKSDVNTVISDLMKVHPSGDEMALACANCPHIKGRHFRGGRPYCIPANGECGCPGFTTRVERFPSYSRSVQSEPQPQYEEHQASDHSRCKDQHVRTVGVLLARMGSTLELDPQGEPEKAKAQLYRLWPALYSCGEVECQAFRTLVEQGLSNRLLELVNSLRTHTEPPETSSR